MLIIVWLIGFVFEFAINVPTSIISSRNTCLVVSSFPSAAVQSAVGYITIAIQYWLPLAIFVTAYSRMIRSLRRVGPQQQGNREL
jgi:hypothetical protein